MNVITWFFINELVNITEFERLFKLRVNSILPYNDVLINKYIDYYFSNFNYLFEIFCFFIDK